MQLINTSLTVINEADVRGQALLALIRQYITFADGYYGFKPIGSSTIKFPVVFVEPKGQRAIMTGTAKFDLYWTFGIYWYVRDAKSQDCVTLCTFIGEALIKLFSNNALGDIGSVPPSNKFFNYANPSGGLYWLKNEIKAIDYSVNYLDPEPAPNLRYERSGRMMVELYDLILK